MNYNTLKYNGFYNVHPNIRPVKLLNDIEKEQVLKMNNNLHHLHFHNLIVTELNAKIGDIICIRNLHNDVYRIVIE
jgi:DNA-directed RNA polymerase subunit H (RpoH/RPB5)